MAKGLDGKMAGETMELSEDSRQQRWVVGVAVE